MARNKKTFQLAAAGVLILSMLLTSCNTTPPASSSSAAAPSSSQAASSGAGESSAPAASGETRTLVVGIPQSPNVQNLETNHLTQLVEEGMNVKFEFDVMPADLNDRKTKFAMLVTSGSKLPEVLTTGFDDVTMSDYAANGIFLPLDDFYNNPETAPNYHRVMDEATRTFIQTNNTLADGKIYSLFSYGTMPWNEQYYRAFMNQEWLDKLSLEMPKTTDDLTNVLRAFVTQDPNGNNKKDEIGFVGSKDGGYGQEIFSYMMSPFTYANFSHKFLHVKDGQIYAAFATPEWRDGLEYMNMLVNEGLMSPLSFTQDYQQLKAMASSEEAIVGMITAGSASNFGPVEGQPYRRMALMPPLTGPKGETNVPTTVVMPTKRWFITKDAADPAFAFMVGDFFLDGDISTTSRYGEKGVDWTDDPEVTKLYRNNTGEAAGPVKFVVDMEGNLWATPQNKHWYAANPKNEIPFVTSFSNKKTADYEAELAAGTAAPDFTSDHMKTYPQYAPKENINALRFTTEELEQISNEKTAIDQYVLDQSVAFITGNRPLSQWDAFQKELTDMGLEKYITAAQAAYERSK